MGKFKHYMRSVRDRFSHPRSTASNSSSLSSTIGSRLLSADTNMHGRSSTTIFTSAASCSQTLIPSPTPNFYRRLRTEPMSSASAAFPPKERGAGAQRISLDAHALLEVNMALLGFAKKLPLEDLRMIGHAPAIPHLSKSAHPQDEHERGALDAIATESLTRSETLSLASTVGDSSSSCVLNTLLRAGHEQNQRQCRDAEAIGMDEASTLSLDTVGGDWKWSIAEFSGWHMSGEAARGGGSNHEATPQTPVDQREVATCPPTAHLKPALSFALRSADSCDLFLESIGLPIPNESSFGISDEHFDELPDWSEVENDSRYNYLENRKAFQWPATASTTSSFSATCRSEIQKVTEAAKIATFEPMSDEDFTALPDWSDVEDDAEHSEFVEEQLRWSTTNSSCSSNPGRDRDG